MYKTSTGIKDLYKKKNFNENIRDGGSFCVW
jgi:hypothetical protein